MGSELSLIDLVAQSGLVVKLVLLLLLLASILSWAAIFDRARVLRQARSTADAFEQKFWSGGDLSALYRDLGQEERRLTGLPLIFRNGFKEYVRLRKVTPNDLQGLILGAERSMRVALSREVDRLETNLPFLATVGSTSPYIGLFGTVWGTMHAFQALGNMQQTTLALVGPGMSEALITTAVGLLAAIPAVVAYNRYASQVERLHNRYEEFMEEFSILLQRQGRG
ncbi:protein TolQ [Lamprobacter modestohalophilus]|uniref:Tol-Pal system protein TolQ n=1 Tax=Lamprobacter modestohalophilus TaxID=1064514 RepID=A0A9X1B3S5_9GAMM|nr:MULTISPECIES: protein TolQ [Lamprobacter]MCF7977493.1 protein TolQ [Chromatiaceae bacterium]MBK1617912.1 protein TolQ [Lamprobacter modestohalophilus]MCF8014895.1 protein TolQ [Chromatiaceae bacterium]MEA1049248.1 protein TolQ [Lamprobacter modestohalophilus]MEA3640142.1 protein TolQ [Lamprobacter sp.]